MTAGTGSGDGARPGDADVLIVGAGPVGLTLANALGFYGVRTTVIEARDALIDYPRGVGLDDESLRAFQAVGMVDRVLPHTNPNQIMRFVNGKGRLLAEISPSEQPYGWPRRNGFVQPLVDAELLAGLDRFDRVRVRWDAKLDGLTQTGDHAEAAVVDSQGRRETLRARYLVGCDGGRSTARRLIGASFEGTTSPTRWLVVDLRTDPLGNPNVYVGADPRRPFVSVSLAHGIRRFEFMVRDDEPDELADDPEFLAGLMARHIPYPRDVEVIRKRVYTHHSRIAGEFGSGRVFLAGDAAHLMPVWQGQGYNSGIRDAANLGWKLAAVVRGDAGPELLGSYDVERRAHAKAMIDLSTTVGKFVSPTGRGVAAVRDAVAVAASIVPAVKRYIVEMRFKPMPRYTRGAVTYLHSDPSTTPVGQQFIQPRVDTRTGQNLLLDDVLGPWFSVLCWNNDPRTVLGAERARWAALGARLVALRPLSQLHSADADDDGIEVVGDRDGALKRWFDGQKASVVFLRPDRFVAGACIAQHAPEVSRALAEELSLEPGEHDDTGPVLHVAQPSSGDHPAEGGA